MAANRSPSPTTSSFLTQPTWSRIARYRSSAWPLSAWMCRTLRRVVPWGKRPIFASFLVNRILWRMDSLQQLRFLPWARLPRCLIRTSSASAPKAVPWCATPGPARSRNYLLLNPRRRPACAISRHTRCAIPLARVRLEPSSSSCTPRAKRCTHSNRASTTRR